MRNNLITQIETLNAQIDSYLDKLLRTEQEDILYDIICQKRARLISMLNLMM